MRLDLEEILDCISGKLLINGRQNSFDKISIDTRSLNGQEIFLAINGKNFDGNKYVLDAIKGGARLCIIDKKYFDIGEIKYPDISIILVKDTLEALEKLAIYVRNKLDIDVIAVTGSVGKTTTKDIIYDFLVSKYKVYKAQGNLNNHLGMPISLVNIDDDSEVCVFELGMNRFGEIDYLVNILRPNIGIITNIAENHIEYFQTSENILKAKMEIINYFSDNSVLILNNEDKLLSNVNCGFKTLRVGFTQECDLYADNINLTSSFTEFDILYNGEKERVTLPLLGKHNVLNSLIGFKICEIFDVPIDLLKSRLELLSISELRQEVFEHKDMIIINDCYNAGPTSMKSSIDVLSLYTNKEKVCILGDMNELGDKSKYYHGEISKYLNSRVDKLVAIGEYRYEYKRYFGNIKNCFCFESIDDFKNEIHNILIGREAILIKASRSLKFEKVANIIKEKF